MRTVTRNVIEAAWNRLCDLDQDESQKLSRQFLEAQPALGIYLGAQNEVLEEQGPDSPMIELSMAIWQAMTQTAGCPLPQVGAEAVDEAEDANAAELQALDEGSEFDWQDQVKWITEEYNQRELLGFSIEVMMAPHKHQPDWAPDSLGLELLCLKTLIDCLDKLEPD